LAKLLDGERDEYQAALNHWLAAVKDPELTLSGQVNRHLIAKGQDHGQWVMTLSAQYHQYFMDYPLSAEVVSDYQAEAQASLSKQADIEAAQRAVSFDDYLTDYFGAPA